MHPSKTQAEAGGGGLLLTAADEGPEANMRGFSVSWRRSRGLPRPGSDTVVCQSYLGY